MIIIIMSFLNQRYYIIISLVGRASARQAEDQGSNPSECHIFYLFRCVLSSLLPLRIVGRSNFYKGLHNLITLIKKRHNNNNYKYDVAIFIYSQKICA